MINTNLTYGLLMVQMTWSILNFTLSTEIICFDLVFFFFFVLIMQNSDAGKMIHGIYVEMAGIHALSLPSKFGKYCSTIKTPQKCLTCR